MHEEPRFTLQLAVLAILLGGLFLIIHIALPLPSAPQETANVGASAAATQATSSPPAVTPTEATSTPPAIEDLTPAVAEAPTSTPANPNEVRRIEDPYRTSPLSFEQVNVLARSALVNIFCSAAGGAMQPISGSGVVIDPRGIVLTNAHVAQYVLLAESGRVNLQCVIRTGSPAIARWQAHVMYLPPQWIEEHAAELLQERPIGTGKHDYALLYIGFPLDRSPRPALFSSLQPDTREAIGFVDDAILAASYPAEFLGAITARMNLYAVTSITTIDELFTLGAHTVDVVSIGSVIGAQSGSSGGAVVNAWARLIGVITTTSEGTTTGERRLRGITLSYIERDMAAQSGSSLSAMLSRDPQEQTAAFWSDTAPSLVDKLLSQLK